MEVSLQKLASGSSDLVPSFQSVAILLILTLILGLQYADFYNWNRVLVRYCDGSSFTGDVETVDPVSQIIFVSYFRSFLRLNLFSNFGV